MEKKGMKRWLILVPLVLGTIGLLERGESCLDALYLAIQMYTMNYGESNNPFLVEVARWTAPLATAGGVILGVQALRTRFGCWWVCRKADSVAVYGDGPEKQKLLERLGQRGAAPGERFVKAPTYILTGSQEENLAFYHRHREKLGDSTVFLKCRSLKPQSVAGANLHLYAPEEIAARQFWKRYSLYPLSKAAGHQPTVAMIGFDRLGEELLLSGLQNNLFSPDQAITYSIFGDPKGFDVIHPELAHITDEVVFLDEPWYRHLQLVREADMVIVAQQTDQPTLLGQLLLAFPEQTFHVFTADPQTMEIMDGRERLHSFCWQELAGDPELLMTDGMSKLGMAINLRYAHLYEGVPETPEELLPQWNKLDTFTRYSNLSAADYHETQRSMLEQEGLPTVYEQIPEDWKERLSHLEHIRWCRYHYLNNWSYGVPENGARKDKHRRIHIDLVDYEKLTEPEKDKDRENLRVMFSVEVPKSAE